jgi:hypothetical protein
MGMTFTIPVLALITAIVVKSFCQAKKRRAIRSDSIISKDGSIDFNGVDSRMSKLAYCALFLTITIYFLTIAIAHISNRDCTINPAMYPNLFITILSYALIGYVIFYGTQSIVTNIRYLRNANSSETCKSYIKSLQQKEPKIVFNYKEMHTVGEDNEIIDFEKNHTFEYSESRDVTASQQFQDIESKINSTKPVILKTVITIVAGDERTRNRLDEEWRNFKSMFVHRKPERYMYGRQLEIESYKKEVMLYWEKTGVPDWRTSVTWYRIFVFLFQGILYKIIFMFATQRATVHIKKVIRCNDDLLQRVLI